MEEIALRQLRYARTLCETGYDRQATAWDGISQPSLS